jgi:hypothetical protein
MPSTFFAHTLDKQPLPPPPQDWQELAVHLRPVAWLPPAITSAAWRLLVVIPQMGTTTNTRFFWTAIDFILDKRSLREETQPYRLSFCPNGQTLEGF